MKRGKARKAVSSYLETPAVRLLRGLGLSPNAVTLLGLLTAGASAFLLSTGYLLAGGVALLVAGVFDLFDGALARATGRVSMYGALLDSIADRVSEAAVLLGLLVFYVGRSETLGAVLVFVAFAGSVMVSYVRARAEGLGIECEVGIMTRPERVVVLGAGLIIAHWWTAAVVVALAAVAALSFVTSGQRIAHVLGQMRRSAA